MTRRITISYLFLWHPQIKPECPLCKQPFKTIIHNVRTLDDYDRYPVQTTSPSMQEHVRFHIVRRPRYMPLVQNQAVMTNDIEAGAEIGGGVLVARGAAAEEDVLTAEEAVGSRHTYNRFEPYRMELMNFYRQDQEAASPNISLSQLWRRYVYDRKLYALPVSDSSTGHFRQWSARFYRCVFGLISERSLFIMVSISQKQSRPDASPDAVDPTRHHLPLEECGAQRQYRDAANERHPADDEHTRAHIPAPFVAIPGRPHQSLHPRAFQLCSLAL